MRKIELDKAKKITLLRWLQQGYIDGVELLAIQREDPMTDEEINEELDRLAKYRHAEQCERLRRLGFCECERQQRRSPKG